MKSKLFVILLLLIPLATALDCNLISNQQWCNDIKNSDLSEAEKDYLLSDIISDKKHYPDHELVSEWNKEISITTPPEGITKKNDDYIKNVWIKIFAVMPSVLFNNDLYISNNGEILTGYGYDLQIPDGTANGDCKTKRYLLENNGRLKVYLNNDYLGNDHTVNYLTNLPDNADVNIIAKYIIKVRTKIKHYTWQKEYYWEDKVQRYRWVCKYDNTEYKTDRLTVSDNVKAKIHNPELEASFEIKDKYLDTVKAEFNSDNTVNAKLTFSDAYLHDNYYVFSEVFNSANALVVKAERQRNREYHNLIVSDEQIILKNTDNCRIKVSDFFNSKFINCNLDYDKIDFEVKTDQTIYSKNEKIKLEINPSREWYKVNYAGKSYTTTGNLELEAVYPHNKITVEHKNKVVQKLIHIKNDQPLNLAFSLVFFGFVNYAVVGLIRKYWGAIIE